MANQYSWEAFKRDHDNHDGFVRMLTSYNPQHDPTYIDKGNVEVFTLEQKHGDEVEQIVLTPNQAFEMRQELDKFLVKHFGPPKEIQIDDRRFVVVPFDDLETVQAA